MKRTMSTDRGIVKGQITDEGIAQMRQRIGYPNPTLRAGLNLGPYNRTASADAIRRWALGIGDDNPLYCDPAYAAASRWRTPIAPPGFEMSTIAYHAHGQSFLTCSGGVHRIKSRSVNDMRLRP